MKSSHELPKYQACSTADTGEAPSSSKSCDPRDRDSESRDHASSVASQNAFIEAPRPISPHATAVNVLPPRVNLAQRQRCQCQDDAVPKLIAQRLASAFVALRSDRKRCGACGGRQPVAARAECLLFVHQNLRTTENLTKASATLQKLLKDDYGIDSGTVRVFSDDDLLTGKFLAVSIPTCTVLVTVIAWRFSTLPILFCVWTAVLVALFASLLTLLFALRYLTGFAAVVTEIPLSLPSDQKTWK